tara:strand:- start:2211 stop:2558 length:348 start_codon:yes stop_codon:yes gene_type:complete
MKLLIPVLLIALAGCSAHPVEQCLQATGAFHAAQLGVEAAMYSDALSLKQEAVAKKISAEGTRQAQACRTAAVTSGGEGVTFATSFLNQATLQLAPMLLDTPLPSLPESPEGGPR